MVLQRRIRLTERHDGRIGTIAPVLVCAIALVACETPGDPFLASLRSPGGTYEVRLTGRVQSAHIFENRVRAEVYKNGALHLPARLIYAAGLFDTSFDDRFGEPEWIAANALRFPAEGSTGGMPPDVLNVRTTAVQPFRGIRIETTREMFLIFDLQRGTGMQFPIARPRQPADGRWFDVLVDPGDADALMRGHGTFAAPMTAGPLRFLITVSPQGVVVGVAAEGGP
jgi:hypothetical protein